MKNIWKTTTTTTKIEIKKLYRRQQPSSAAFFFNVLRTSYYRHYRNLNASLSASRYVARAHGKEGKPSNDCLFINDVTHEVF